MKTRIIALLILGVSVFYSCQKEEEVKPATNPRFSVAFIQEIDSDGVQFAANVYDFGSDEILEYGFVYSPTPVPKVEKDDVVSQTGKPSASFELKGTHSMKLGEKYWVAAFIKTSKGIVYSKVIDFVSKGSLGFLFSEMHIPDLVYFGDTIEVTGSDFSNVLSNFQVMVQGVPGRVVEVSESGFKFVLPMLFPFGEKQVLSSVFDVEITVAGKVLELEVPMNFQQPSFQIDPNYIINYEDIVEIKGLYLGSETVEIRYLGKGGEEFKLPVINYSDSKIRFNPFFNFKEQNPDLIITVRGKKFFLPKAFKLKGPEIIPGQSFSTNFYQEFTIQGKNLNFNSPYWNELTFAGVYLQHEVISVTPSELTLRIFGSGSSFIPRNIEVFINNSGQRSVNSAKVKFTNPVLPFLDGNKIFKDFYDYGGGVSVGGSGYLYGLNSIYKLTPSSRKLELVAENNISDAYLSNIFLVRSPNGKLYSGGYYEEDYLNPGNPEIFEFNPVTNSITKLPKIPTEVVLSVSVYATERYLYYEGGYKIVPNADNEEKNERWRYEFSTKVWKLLSSQTETKGYVSKFKSFWYNGKLFKIGLEHPEDNFKVLMEFDPNQETWTTVANLSRVEIIDSSVIPVIGNEAFLVSSDQIIRLNLDNYSESIVQNLFSEDASIRFNPFQIMGINGKLYSSHRYNGVFELDPDYFTY